MAEQENQQAPLPQQTNPYGRVDEELASVATKELKRKKRMKILLYVAIFAVFQTAVITLFALTIMKFRTPRFRVSSASFETLDVQPASFNLRMNAQLSVKNANFGHFRYKNTTIDFYYRDIKVGEAFVDRARAKWRSTRRFNVTVNLTSTNVTDNTQLTSDITAGILPLRAQSRLRGKVTIMVIMKRNKSSNMNCTMGLGIQARQVQELMCR